MQAQPNNPPLLRFGPFQLDLQACELRKGDLPIHLAPQPYKVLALLASCPHKVFTRQDIQREIWGDETFVDFEQGLNVAIRQIRAALCDDAEMPRYIETLPRRGYRFIAQVIGHPATAKGATAAGAGEYATASGLSARLLLPGRRAMSVVVGFVLVLAALVFVWRIERGRAGAGDIRPTIHSIAVLPLANLSHDPEQEYFADGMTDELITNLAKISALRVISRTSVMRYKRATPPLQQIGKELGVDAVVEGSVLRSGDHVRITAQLVEASTDRHLWAESYQRDVHDVLQLQDDLAGAIAKQVQAKLTPQERVRLTHSVNAEAYELYLKGRYNWNNRGTRSTDNSERLTRAIDLLQRAVAIDPNYAPAWADLAKAYGVLGGAELMPMSEVFPKAKSAALKALELEPDLGEAHSVLAGILNDFEWNWPAAEKEDRRAIEVNPSDATAHQWYAMHLSWAGRSAEAIAEIERARELDPTSVPICATVSRIFLWAGQYDRAMVEAQKTLELEPTEATSYLVLAQVDLKNGDYQKAISELQTVARLNNENPRSIAWTAWGYALAGQRRKAVAILEKVKQVCRREYCPPTSIAMVYGALGQKDQAFAWLDKALIHGDGIQLSMIKVSPYFDSLRPDPRFAEVLRRRGLPQ